MSDCKNCGKRDVCQYINEYNTQKERFESINIGNGKYGLLNIEISCRYFARANLIYDAQLDRHIWGIIGENK